VIEFSEEVGFLFRGAEDWQWYLFFVIYFAIGGYLPHSNTVAEWLNLPMVLLGMVSILAESDEFLDPVALSLEEELPDMVGSFLGMSVSR
jgi:hypothetical protein